MRHYCFVNICRNQYGPYYITFYYSEPVCANFVDRIWYGGSGGVTGRPLLPMYYMSYTNTSIFFCRNASSKTILQI